MGNYTCDRCGYITKQKTHFINHLNRKFICKSIDGDIPLDMIIKKYNLEDKIKKTDSKSRVNDSKLLKNVSKLTNLSVPKKIYECEFCKKISNRYGNYKRHLISCKIKKEYDEANSKLKIHNLQQKITNLEQTIKSGGNINNTINSNTTINSNDTINNQIIINNFGSEDLSYLTEEELTRYVKNLPPGLLKFIEKIHCNPKHPENTNLRRTNKKHS